MNVVAECGPIYRLTCRCTRDDRLGHSRLIDRVSALEHELSKYVYVPLHELHMIRLGSQHKEPAAGEPQLDKNCVKYCSGRPCHTNQ